MGYMVWKFLTLKLKKIKLKGNVCKQKDVYVQHTQENGVI